MIDCTKFTTRIRREKYQFPNFLLLLLLLSTKTESTSQDFVLQCIDYTNYDDAAHKMLVSYFNYNHRYERRPENFWFFRSLNVFHDVRVDLSYGGND
mmetsp:Transcript_43713/g.49579  ORF Transcript_43713/g.49579 Transcript_43713/m.49579 type:complete len:97 (+) Transcript_43713:478-768(+)